MQVIKYGRIKPTKITCQGCGATLGYTERDVVLKRLPGRDFYYVVCPVCGRKTSIYLKEG